ncbi:S41 family peptidase [Zavarzinia sp. CC-PAN008]
MRNVVKLAGAIALLAPSVLVPAALMPASAVAASSETYRQLNLFGDVFERVRSDYVEEVPDNKMIEAAINGMLSSLDPHSSYMNAKNYGDMQVQTRGEFGGLGIEVTMENGLVKVVTPIDDTPAARAGIKTGDFIVALDGTQVMGMTLSEAVDKMRGPVDSKIVLTLARPGVEQPFDVSLNRAVIRIRSVRARREGDVAYVRITSFNEQTESNLEQSLDRLSKEIGADKLQGLVLDLRNNPGGLLDQAVAVSDAFLDQGEIVSTRGRHAEDTTRYSAQRGELLPGKPVIVLINGGSASASEIVAGALQDHRRATILGTRSFGKGSVQTIIPIQGQGALRLTTARYYTPAGRSIQAKGIDADIDVRQTEAEAETTAPSMVRSEASLPNHLRGEGEGEEQSVPLAAEDIPEDQAKDRQLAYALDLLRGVNVTGTTSN